jgi:hypothetical protein
MRNSTFILALGLMLLYSGCQSHAPRQQTSERKNVTPKEIETIESRLGDFKTKREINDLRAALNLLLTVSPSETAPAAVRTFDLEKTKAWFHWFELSDAAKDKSFNPKKLPLLNMTVPGSDEYPSGISPKVVRESDLRQKYEEALAENRRYALEFGFQYQLRSLDERADDGIQTFLHKAASSAPELRSKIQDLLNSSNLSIERKQQFKSLL